MSGTTYTVTDQNSLIAGTAAASLAGTQSATLTLSAANPLTLAGVIPIPVAAGRTLTLQGSGPGLAGSFILAVDGAGLLILATNDTNAGTPLSGGIEMSNDATLELAPANLFQSPPAGTGEIYIVSASLDAAGAVATGLLRIDGTIMPTNPIGLGLPLLPAAVSGAKVTGVNIGGTAALTATIDLANIVATANATTLDTGFGITIPTAGGSVKLEFDSAAPHNFLLQPDGAGGTFITETAFAIAPGVTVIGAAGAILTIPFTNAAEAPTEQPVVAPLNAAVTAGTAVAFTTTPGATLPAVAAGQTLEIIAHTGGVYSLPGAAAGTVNGSTVSGAAAFINDSSAAETVYGGSAPGQLLAVGNGGLDYEGGLGAGTILAGGGANRITVPVGGGGQAILLADAADTVFALGGNDFIAAGLGANRIRLGAGNDTVQSIGADTIYGGTGSNSIVSNAANPLVFLGAGSTQFTGTGIATSGAAPTVVGSSGNDSIASGYSETVYLGTGISAVSLQGADTLVGNTGPASILTAINPAPSLHGGSMIFLGTGPSSATLQGGDTLVGNTGNASIVTAATLSPTINGGSTVFLGTGTSSATLQGSDTLIGNTGNASIVTGQNFNHNLIFLGGGLANVTLNAVDTLVGGTVAATIAANSASVTFQESGPLVFSTPSEFSVPPTLVGNAASSVTLNGASRSGPGVVYFDYGPTNFQIGNETDTVIGAGPALNVTAGVGGGTFVGASVGGNYLAGGGGRGVLVAGGNGDTLVGGANTSLFMAGTGNETLVATASNNLFTFTRGNAGTDLVTNFGANDFIHFAGFPSTESAAALAGAVTVNGSEILSLSDGTRITLQNFTGFSPYRFE